MPNFHVACTFHVLSSLRRKTMWLSFLGSNVITFTLLYACFKLTTSSVLLLKFSMFCMWPILKVSDYIFSTSRQQLCLDDHILSKDINHVIILMTQAETLSDTCLCFR